MRMLSSLRRSATPWLLASALLVAMACSAVVAPPDRLRCDPEATGNVCGENAFCGSEGPDRGYCVTMACSPTESCDGEDNDCDGIVDEDLADTAEECNAEDDDCDGLFDEGLDRDGDGYTPCGTPSDCGTPDVVCATDPSLIDCNDGLDNVNPGAPELCDAIDHNCDGFAVPDGAVGSDLSAPRDVLCSAPSPWCEPTVGCVAADCNAPRPGAACTGGLVCNPSDGQCVSVDCTPEACASRGGDLFCSPLSGECERRKGPGQDCDADEECGSGVCAAPESLGVPRASPGLCVQACCSDNDCALGQYCWESGTGSRSCVPLDFQPALTQRAQLGSTPAGANCASSAECRSGLCELGTCTGPCASAAECSVGGCGPINRSDGRVVFACDEGWRGRDESCSSDSQCPFGTCECGLGCRCSTTICGSDEDCGPIFTKCVYYRGQSSGAVFGACAFNEADGQNCCRPSDCSNGQLCRPQLATQNDGRLWPMYCVDKGS